jgi:hypothetical protein
VLRSLSQKLGAFLSLFAELQRRRVIRALVGYGIAAFAVLQIADPQALAKDPAEALQRGASGILGGNHDPDHSADCSWSSGRVQETIDARSNVRHLDHPLVAAEERGLRERFRPWAPTTLD